ncbi:hypothetical protein C8Q76DRAFT_791014 [Earliella scabrosa]|nr:hypothetical protein C8Q76DRAFT_791014 [Earliella scabrosa]
MRSNGATRNVLRDHHFAAPTNGLSVISLSQGVQEDAERVLLSPADIARLDASEVRALVRLWLKVPERANFLRDRAELLSCLETEGVTVNWHRLLRWRDSETRVSRRVPSGASRREWLLDWHVYDLVIHGRVDVPPPSEADPAKTPSSPLTSIPEGDAGPIPAADAHPVPEAPVPNSERIPSPDVAPKLTRPLAAHGSNPGRVDVPSQDVVVQGATSTGQDVCPRVASSRASLVPEGPRAGSLDAGLGFQGAASELGTPVEPSMRPPSTGSQRQDGSERTSGGSHDSRAPSGSPPRHGSVSAGVPPRKAAGIHGDTPEFDREIAHGWEGLPAARPGFDGPASPARPAETLVDRALRACGYESEGTWGQEGQEEDYEDEDESAWVGRGNIAAFMQDLRVAAQGRRKVVTVLRDIPFRYYRQSEQVALDNDVLVDALVAHAVPRARDAYISVPIHFDCEVAYERLALVEQPGQYELLSQGETDLAPHVAVHPRRAMNNVQWALDFVLEGLDDEQLPRVPRRGGARRVEGRPTRVPSKRPRDASAEVGRESVGAQSSGRTPELALQDPPTMGSRGPQEAGRLRRPKKARAQSDSEEDETAITEAIVAWMETHRDGALLELPGVQDMRATANLNVGQVVSELLTWCETTSKLMAVGHTDATLEEAPKRRITQAHVAAFIHRGPQWTALALQCWRLYTQHRDQTAMLVEIERAHRNDVTLGVKTLRNLIQWSVAGPERGPHPLIGVLSAKALQQEIVLRSTSGPRGVRESRSPLRTESRARSSRAGSARAPVSVVDGSDVGGGISSSEESGSMRSDDAGRSVSSSEPAPRAPRGKAVVRGAAPSIDDAADDDAQAGQSEPASDTRAQAQGPWAPASTPEHDGTKPPKRRPSKKVVLALRALKASRTGRSGLVGPRPRKRENTKFRG